MKPHLRQPASKTSDEVMLGLLETGNLDNVLSAIQLRANEAKKKAHEVEGKAKAEAIITNENARAQASNIVKMATEKAVEIRAEAVQETRAIQIARNELRDAESALASERRRHNSLVAELNSDLRAFNKKWEA